MTAVPASTGRRAADLCDADCGARVREAFGGPPVPRRRTCSTRFISRAEDRWLRDRRRRSVVPRTVGFRDGFHFDPGQGYGTAAMIASCRSGTAAGLSAQFPARTPTSKTTPATRRWSRTASATCTRGPRNTCETVVARRRVGKREANLLRQRPHRIGVSGRWPMTALGGASLTPSTRTTLEPRLCRGEAWTQLAVVTSIAQLHDMCVWAGGTHHSIATILTCRACFAAQECIAPAYERTKPCGLTGRFA